MWLVVLLGQPKKSRDWPPGVQFDEAALLLFGIREGVWSGILKTGRLSWTLSLYTMELHRHIVSAPAERKLLIKI